MGDRQKRPSSKGFGEKSTRPSQNTATRRGGYKGTGKGTSHRGGTRPPAPPSKGCCPMVAAVRSVRHGRYRLARRYAAMSVRLIAERLIRA